jgi:hypothetical protein
VLIRRCIQKLPDWVDNEISGYNDEHSLRSNTKGYGGKTHYKDSQNSNTTATSGRELYHLQFSLRAASPETFGYILVYTYIHTYIHTYIYIYKTKVPFSVNKLVYSDKITPDNRVGFKRPNTSTPHLNNTQISNLCHLLRGCRALRKAMPSPHKHTHTHTHTHTRGSYHSTTYRVRNSIKYSLIRCFVWE